MQTSPTIYGYEQISSLTIYGYEQISPLLIESANKSCHVRVCAYTTPLIKRANESYHVQVCAGITSHDQSAKESYHLWVEWSEESLWWAGMNCEVLPTITVFLTWKRVPDS